MADEKKGVNWGQVGTAVGGSLLGMIGQNARARKQHKRQKELMGIQLGNQQRLNEQGQKLQMQTWRETSYGPQMEMMKQAGVNPSLMYGMSGGGANTTGSQGGGSAASGQAAAPMDIGNALQIGMMKSQIDLANSQADKNKAEASNIRGEEGTQGAAMIKKTLADAKTIGELGNKYNAEAEKLKGIDTEVAREQKKMLAQETLRKGVDMELMKKKIKLTEAQMKQVEAKILQDWSMVGIKGVGVAVNGILGAIVNAKFAGAAAGKAVEKTLNKY